MAVNTQTLIRPHFEVVKIVDGGGMIVRNRIYQKRKEIEVRFYGIDAPEIKKCPKLLADEQNTHLPGRFLRKLGRISFQYLKDNIPPGTAITLIQEVGNTEDVYGRTLAYALLNNGDTINAMMVREGYAKAYPDVYCDELPTYQALSLDAKTNGWGLYGIVPVF